MNNHSSVHLYYRIDQRTNSENNNKNGGNNNEEKV
jgi:hypothetical protein